MSGNDELQQQIIQLQQQNAELQEQLLRAQKMSSVGQLASSITHEFNNILTTVINYGKMGLRHKAPETREKAFNRILSAGQRAAKITNSMLAYARAKGDRRDEMDLGMLVGDVLILVEKDLQMHRVRLQTDILGNPVCEVNVARLQQVMMNLIVNARQAMDDDEGGQLYLTVRMSEDGKMGEISLRDTGPGIPADKLPKIFEPFYTTKQSDEHGQGGTGLGLAFCRDVIEEHHGRMRVESVVGQGTTFTIRLPLAAAQSDRKSA